MIKINELIEKLNEIKTEHGNLPVYIEDTIGIFNIDKQSLNVKKDQYGKFLTIKCED